MINIDNRIGAVGFNSVIAPSFYPIRLIKVDRTTGDIERDDNGMAVACLPGTPGELVGKVRSKYDMLNITCVVDFWKLESVRNS